MYEKIVTSASHTTKTADRFESLYQDQLWRGLDRVLSQTAPGANLNKHGLGPLAAWRHRVNGTEIPETLVDVSRRSAYGAVTVVPMLERLRRTIDGNILLIKGPEIAALYPQPILRPFGDIDIVVEDLETAEKQLSNAGFAAVGPANHVVPGHHHDRPLRLKGMALAVEIHRNAGWLSWQQRPTNRELIFRSAQSATGVDGILALRPADRALHLAAHSWRHGPFYSYIHLIDIALAREIADADEVQWLARSWGLEQVWNTLNNSIDAIFFGQGGWPCGIDRIWSRHLLEMREQTLWEFYTAFYLRGLAAPGFRRKVEAILEDLRFSLTAHPWQTRSEKIMRIGNAFARSLKPASAHRFR